MQAYNFETSGKLKAPSGDALKAADADVAVIALSRGTAGDGRPYYAYVAVQPSRYRAFYELSVAGKTIKLGDYGRVILAGFEAAPPPDVVRHMREQYGYDERYEQAVRAEVARQRGVFSASQEEKRLMDIVAAMKAGKK